MATPVANFSGADARVAPIAAASDVCSSCVVGMTNPLVAEAVRSSRVKRFSGRAEDFEDFERSWEFYLRLMHGAVPGVMSDAVVLMTLRGYLDEASATALESQLHCDPSLSYYKFWGELKDKFLRDARTTHRQNWRAVKLQITGPRLSLYDWARFQAAYVAKRGLVEDWTESEDQQYVFSQLPPEYQARVLRETGKRRATKKWVRVVVPPALTNSEIIDELAGELGRDLQGVILERRNFIIPCIGEAEMKHLLDMDGSLMDGHIVRIQRADYSMPGDDIFAFVKRLLEEDEELHRLRRFYGCGEDPLAPRGGVRAVQVEEVKQQQQQFKGSDRPKKMQDDRGRSSAGKGGRGPFEKKSTGAAKGSSEVKAPQPSRGGGQANKERSKSPPKLSTRMKCFECQRLERPFDHDYLQCSFSKAAFLARSAKGPEVAAKTEDRPATPPRPRPEAE